VALRIIGPDMAGDPATRARLNRESTALASVDHPNVIPIYEAGEADGRLFIATRWVPGVNLGALAREQGPLEPPRAVRIVNQVASALQAAHALGIMHRNVKPSSVLVTETDHAHLTDFGLARRSSDLSGLTVQEQLLESFDYLAPEYIEGAAVDARVDIYGLGCVLHEALTAEVPYPAATPAAKMYAHRSADPPSIRARRPEVPPALDVAARRAMAKDPSERQQSTGEFAIEVAGAFQMSQPPWPIRTPASEVIDIEEPAHDRHVPTATGDGGRRSAGSPPDRWHEPTYFAPPRRTVARPIAIACALVLFVAAPMTLLLVLLIHG
jgi:serine/threonine protein kinase